MENPFTSKKHSVSDEVILTPIEKVALHLRSLGETALFADLGQSSAGINLNLTDVDRSALLDELTPAINSLGFN